MRRKPKSPVGSRIDVVSAPQKSAGAEYDLESETLAGIRPNGEGADSDIEIDSTLGFPSEDVESETEEAAEERVAVEAGNGGPPPNPFIDPITAQIRILASVYTDVKKARVAQSGNRLKRMAEIEGGFKGFAALGKTIEDLKHVEDVLGNSLRSLLKQHVLWPGFLSEMSGLTGPSVARIIGYIGDPWRYPGQKCSEGHYHRPVYLVGSPCPRKVRVGKGKDAVWKDCPGRMLAPRDGDGPRSLWHRFGLHVTSEGKAPRKEAGTKCTYDPEAKAWVLGPQGIADQIVRQAGKPSYVVRTGRMAGRTVVRDAGLTAKYVGVWAATKERLARERGIVERVTAIEIGSGDSPPSSEGQISDGVPDMMAVVVVGHGDSVGPEADGTAETISGNGSATGGLRPLRPFEIDDIARKVAAKALLGDLLMEWKRRMPLDAERHTEIESIPGEEAASS